MAEATATSGTPDKVVWDKDGVCVDAELDAHFKEASAKVLGEVEEGEEPVVQEMYYDYSAPQQVQETEQFTSEPTTNPQDSTDPNQFPSMLSIDPPSPADLHGGVESEGHQPEGTDAVKPPASPASTTPSSPQPPPPALPDDE